VSMADIQPSNASTMGCRQSSGAASPIWRRGAAEPATQSRTNGGTSRSPMPHNGSKQNKTDYGRTPEGLHMQTTPGENPGENPRADEAPTQPRDHCYVRHDLECLRPTRPVSPRSCQGCAMRETGIPSPIPEEIAAESEVA
jgi:hypothetical protein